MENRGNQYNGEHTLQHTSYPGDTNLLLGLYTSILESENHLVLPDALRVEFRDGLYISQGFDQNIMVLTIRAFEAIYNRITAFNLADPVARLLLRMILGSAHRTEVKADGGIQIPNSLKEFASLTRDVVMVGQGDFIELWAPDAWNVQQQKILTAEAERFAALNLSTR